jgi:hypothetical protein
MARHVIGASGCHVVIHQLPAHGHFVTPEGADARQLVAGQSPGPGGRTSAVTVSLRPLCSQPSDPGPEVTGPTSRSGPTELIAGLYREGGPLQLASRCRTANPVGGTITISSASGRLITHRTVKPGKFGVFPLPPGGYTVSGSTGDTANGIPIQLGPESIKVTRHHTSRLNIVEKVK